MSCCCKSATSPSANQGRTLLPMAPSGCCTPPAPSEALGGAPGGPPVNKVRYFGAGAVALAVWCGLYTQIGALANWLGFAVLSLAQGSPLGDAVTFFLYDTAKIMLLLVIMVYGIAWLRAGMQTERVREYLAGRGRGLGYILGAGFGAITPFCSCSSIPLFLGFTMARIPVGITMAFLITSPLINEIAVVLLWGLLGWKFTLLYVVVGMGAGVVGGMLMDAMRAERWLQPFLLDALNGNHSAGATGNTMAPVAVVAGRLRAPNLMERHAFALSETRGIVRRVWLWVIAGVGLGAALHGYVPQEWFAANLGAGQWWSVPVAVAVGTPLYTNVTGIVPIMESLLLKGLPLGTTLAFCMSTVAASLPEVMLLKQVMRVKLLALFLGMLLVMFTLVGWLFNLIGPVL